MFLTNLFNLKKECIHSHVAPNLESAYCPDCGKLIKNEWYITRCSCCGVKLKSIKQNNNIVPQFNYCCNCGSKEYVIEKLDKIEYAIIREYMENTNYIFLLIFKYEPNTMMPQLFYWIINKKNKEERIIHIKDFIEESYLLFPQIILCLPIFCIMNAVIHP